MKDLRIIKTKALIKKAFIEMVKEMGYRKVTVKALCERAEINRNTFYLHYSDKDELVKCLLSEALDVIKKDSNILSLKTYSDLIKQNREEFTADIEGFLKSLNDDLDLYRIILKDEDLYGYFKGFQETIEKIVIKRCEINTPSDMLIFNYIINGLTGVLAYWIKKECLSTKETAKILTNLIFKDVSEFIK